MKTEKKPTRAQFATRLGVIAVTVGSSVGLGNIWRFPYEAGNNGGAAFMLCYIAFILVLGIPVIVAEFVLGRASKTDFFSCFQKLNAPKGWRVLGLIGIVASLMILSFYSVVSGWTLEYLSQSVSGSLTDIAGSNGGFSAYFADFSTHSMRPVWWTIAFLAINYLVVSGGVQKGIERVSNILMPLLFMLLIALCINSLFLPGVAQGLKFLFAPDFSKITGDVVLSAMGQAFFSMSIGLGCMLTYASYFNNKTSLLRTATTTALLDTLVAVLAGVLIFPAVFTYGISPTQGPTLVFEVLPTIFSEMPGGSLWASIFFLMLFVASLTSTISMSEISIAFFVDKLGWTRRTACAVSGALAISGGLLCALSFNGISVFKVGSYVVNFFNLFNNVSSNVLLPLGGLFISIFVGWVLSRKTFFDQLTTGGRCPSSVISALRFLLRYICPALILIIFAASLGII